MYLIYSERNHLLYSGMSRVLIYLLFIKKKKKYLYLHWNTAYVLSKHNQTVRKKFEIFFDFFFRCCVLLLFDFCDFSANEKILWMLRYTYLIVSTITLLSGVVESVVDDLYIFQQFLNEKKIYNEIQVFLHILKLYPEEKKQEIKFCVRILLF